MTGMTEKMGLWSFNEGHNGPEGDKAAGNKSLISLVPVDTMQSLLYYPFDMEDNTLTPIIDSDAELHALEAFLDEYNAEERGTKPMQVPVNEVYTNTLETAVEIEASSESSGSEDTTDTPHNSRCGAPGTTALRE
ncbi:hypothetical protein BBJ28_00022794 [Nothophytophthora sp. Chile5]|nr:hypothetical protein BBJ28_00022794 [Nothophytophthora sp. Chile5]